MQNWKENSKVILELEVRSMDHLNVSELLHTNPWRDTNFQYVIFSVTYFGSNLLWVTENLGYWK